MKMQKKWRGQSQDGSVSVFPSTILTQSTSSLRPPSIQRAFQPTASFVHSLAPPPPMSRFQDQNLNEVLARSLPRGGEIVLFLLLLIFAALTPSFLPSFPLRTLDAASARSPRHDDGYRSRDRDQKFQSLKYLAIYTIFAIKISSISYSFSNSIDSSSIHFPAECDWGLYPFVFLASGIGL